MKAQAFDDGYWLRLIHDGSTWKRHEYCKDIFWYFRAMHGHSGGVRTSPELMQCTPVPYDCKKKYFHRRGSQWVFQSVLLSRIIPGGEEEDKARQAVFLTHLNPCGRDPEEEKPHVDHSSSKKVPHESRWTRN